MTAEVRTRGVDRRSRRVAPIIAVLAFAGLVASFMQTLVTPIQGQLPELLGAPRDQTAWVFTVTLVAAGVVTPLAGRLGDLYGRRRIALVLLAHLVAGSVLCALAPGLPLLLVGRAMQGAVMGVIPLGISLLGSLLPRERVATGIAILSATMGIGGGLGLPASAALAELVDWHALFWVSAALAVAAMLLVWLVVPPVPVVAEETLDVWGALTLAGMLASTLLVLAQGYSWGWTSPLTLAVAGAAVVFATAWYFRERYAVHPLIHLEMLAHRPVLLTNLASFAMAVSLFASTVTFPQILTLPEAEGVGLGMSLIESSWILLPSGVMMMLLSPFAGRLIARFGARALLATGGGFLALAYVWTLLASTQPWHLLVANILIGIGIGVGFSTMPTLILAAVPSVRAGEANGVNALARSLGSSTAAAIAGAVLAAGAVAGSSPSVASFRAVWMVGCAAGLACLIISCVRADARRDRA